MASQVHKQEGDAYHAHHFAHGQFFHGCERDIHRLLVRLHEARIEGDASREQRKTIPPEILTKRIANTCEHNYVCILRHEEAIIGLATLVPAHTITEGFHGTIRDFVIHPEHDFSSTIQILVQFVIEKACAARMRVVLSTIYTREQEQACRELGFKAYDDGHMRLVIQEPLLSSSAKE